MASQPLVMITIWIIYLLFYGLNSYLFERKQSAEFYEMVVPALSVGLIGPIFLLYKLCCQLSKECRSQWLSQQLQHLNRQLENHRCLFERECEILLRRVVSDTDAKLMAVDDSYVRWREVGFKAQWDSVYGVHFDEHLEEIRKTLAELSEELIHICNISTQVMNAQAQITKDAISSLPKQSGVDRAKAIVYWFRKGKKNTARLLESLAVSINHFRKLSAQAPQLIRPRPIVKAQTSPSIPTFSRPRHCLPPEILSIREVSKQLFSELATAANCTCHKVNLRLQIQNSKDSKMPVEVTKNIVSSFHLITTCEPLPPKDDATLDHAIVNCVCLTIDSCLEEHLGSLSSLAAGLARPHTNWADSRSVVVAAARHVQFTNTQTNATSCNVSVDVSINNNSATCYSTTTITKMTNTISPSSTPFTSTSIRTIENLCSLLADIRCSIFTEELLGIIKSAGYSAQTTTPCYRHLMYLSQPEYRTTQRLSLDQILRRPDRPYFFPREQRLKNAHLLALSVLQFGAISPNSWFQAHWRSKDVYYFLDLNEHRVNFEAPLEPYVSPRFPGAAKPIPGKGKAVNICLPDGSIYTPPEQSAPPHIRPLDGITKSEQLFSLAIVLIEIAFGLPLFEIYEPKSGVGPPMRSLQAKEQVVQQIQTERDYFMEFVKVRRILQWNMLAKEMGSAYTEVVRRCLFGELGSAGGDRDISSAKDMPGSREFGGGQGAVDGAGAGRRENRGQASSRLTAIPEVDLDRREVQELFWENVVCELERLQLR